MKKFFTSFKSVVAAVVMASMTLAASCSYDDTAIKNDIAQIQQDLTALTERVAALEKRLGDEVDALTALINGKVVVTSVEKVGDATKVTLSDGTTFTVYPECTVVDTDTDTNTYISIAEENGVLYFAVYEMGEFSEWLLIDGEKVPVYDGNTDDNICDDPYEPVAPMFQVNNETGNIEVSIDGGLTWTNSGLSAAQAGVQVFTDAKVNDDNTVTFTMADGSTFDVVIAELIEFDTTRASLFVKPGEVKEIGVTINDAVADVNIMNQPLGWKAEIAPAAADEDDVDAGMGVLAVGGTEFTLKITGPSQAFVNAGYAEAAGDITVHFNSDNGYCKVGKIAVELAQITLDVDKEGNVTITNSWVDSYTKTNYWGDAEEIVEFNNYYLAIMPLNFYNEDLSQIYNASWGEFMEPAAGAWIQNVHTNINPDFNTYESATYVEGENEQWIFKATVEQILDQLDWYGNMTYEGESFMIVVIPTDPTNSSKPILEQAIAAPFKQLNIKLELIDATWNNFYVDATLAGAVQYHINVESKATIDGWINEGFYDDLQSVYEANINSWQMYGGNFGAYILTNDVFMENASINDVFNYGMEYPYIYGFAPNTTYYVAIIAEEEGKESYSFADVKFFEFTTEDIVAAEPAAEYSIVRDDESCTYYNIYADVTVPSTTNTIYYKWLDEEPMEAEVVKEELIEYDYTITDFTNGYTVSMSTSADYAGHTKYLAILIIDAEGNYTVGWQALATNEVNINEDVVLTIEKVEFATVDKVADITVGGLEGVEFTAIKAYSSTNSAWSVLDESELQDLAYGDDYRYISYKTNPFTILRTADYKTVATEEKTYVIAVAAQLADGSYTKTTYGEFTFEPIAVEVPEGPIAMTSYTTGEADSYCTYFYFTDGTGNNEVKFAVVDEVVAEDGYIIEYEFSTWQSSLSYVWSNHHFTFVDGSLKVGGKAYANSAVKNASAKVDANGVWTLEFTVDGNDIVFTYTK